MASAVLTVEADGNIQSPELPRRVWCHPMLSVFNSTVKISLSSKTDSSASLTLKYSKISHGIDQLLL